MPEFNGNGDEERRYDMNFDRLAERLGLETEEYLELAELFLETGSSDLGILKSAVEQGNIEETIKAAHAIKGSSGNLGLMDIYETAKGIEQGARGNSLEGAGQAVEAIQGEIEILARYISQKSSVS